MPLWRVDAANGRVTRLIQQGHVAAVAITPQGPVVAMDSLTAPADLYRVGPVAPGGGDGHCCSSESGRRSWAGVVVGA